MIHDVVVSQQLTVKWPINGSCRRHRYDVILSVLCQQDAVAAVADTLCAP